jgi:hypothetical protein
MTITIDITPEVRSALARQAAAQGREVESYAASLLAEAVHPTAGAVTNVEKRKREGEKSLVEVCAMVRGLTDDVDFSRDPDTGRPVDLS